MFISPPSIITLMNNLIYCWRKTTLTYKLPFDQNHYITQSITKEMYYKINGIISSELASAE